MARIKALRDVTKTVETKTPEGVFEEEVFVRQQIVLREVEEIRDFEEISRISSKGTYKKRCIVYTENGPIIAAHSFEELLEIKRNQHKSTQIGFKYGKARTNR